MTILSIIAWTITGLIAVFLGKGAVEKIIGTQEMVGNFAYMKLEKYRVITGVGELLGVILLLIPATSLYGMVLVTSFMSAAVVLHLSLMGGAKTYMPIVVGVLTLLSYVLRTI
jgi:DoxX-like family